MPLTLAFGSASSHDSAVSFWAGPEQDSERRKLRHVATRSYLGFSSRRSTLRKNHGVSRTALATRRETKSPSKATILWAYFARVLNRIHIEQLEALACVSACKKPNLFQPAPYSHGGHNRPSKRRSTKSRSGLADLRSK